MALEQVTFATTDHQEATRSFKEKRKPKKDKVKSAAPTVGSGIGSGGKKR